MLVPACQRHFAETRMDLACHVWPARVQNGSTICLGSPGAVPPVFPQKSKTRSRIVKQLVASVASLTHPALIQNLLLRSGCRPGDLARNLRSLRGTASPRGVPGAIAVDVFRGCLTRWRPPSGGRRLVASTPLFREHATDPGRRRRVRRNSLRTGARSWFVTPGLYLVISHLFRLG